MENNERRNRESEDRSDFWGGEQLDSGSWASDDMGSQFSSSADDAEEEFEDYELSSDEGRAEWDARGMESGSDSEANETMPYRSDRHNGWNREGNPSGDGGYGSQGGEP